jgi:hypothetical protein
MVEIAAHMKFRLKKKLHPTMSPVYPERKWIKEKSTTQRRES